MALTQQQISGLNALAGKKNLTATDQANLNYAKSQGYTLPSTSLTAPVVPQGAVPINGAQYGTKELQQANFTNIQPLGNTLYGIPKVPTSLSQEQLNTPTITPTPTLPTSYDPNTFVSSSKAYFDQVMNDYTTSQQEAAKLNEQKLNERTAISKLMETIGKKGTDYQSQLDSLGVTQSTNQLEDLNKQIAAATAAFNKQVVGAESQTADITTGVVGGQVNMIRRQQAAEVGALTSVAQAVQGNIELAYQTAEKSINLKYEPLENQLKQELQQLDFIYQDLSSAEKKQADSRATLLNERLRLIEEQKTEENNVNNIALEAAKNGADMNTINKIRNSKTVGEAIANAGKSLETVGGNYEVIKDAFGNTVSIFDKKTGRFVTPGGGNTNDPGSGGGAGSGGSGVVKTASGEAYDIGSYATDPNHEASIQNILNKIGQFKSTADIDAYIKSVAPKSPVTGAMIESAANKYGVSWEMMTAIMQQDSSLGTAGKAVRTFNPGNVGNNDSGQLVNFGNWQSGVDAVAKNLAGRKTDGKTASSSKYEQQVKQAASDPAYFKSLSNEQKQLILSEATKLGITIKPITDKEIESYASQYLSTGQIPSGIPEGGLTYVIEKAKGLPRPNGSLIDTGTLLSPDNTKINSTQKEGVLALYDIQNKIKEAQTLFNSIAAKGLVSGVISSVKPTADQQKYLSLKTQITDLISRARSGAALTAEEQKFYGDLLPSIYNNTLFLGKKGDSMLQSFSDAIGGTIDTKTAGFGVDIIGREKVVNGKTLVRVFENGQLGWKDK